MWSYVSIDEDSNGCKTLTPKQYDFFCLFCFKVEKKFQGLFYIELKYLKSIQNYPFKVLNKYI